MQEDPQLKMLFDYTVFHIGIYISLTTAILAAINFKTKKKRDWWFLAPICLFVGAGGCGGIVGSNIWRYETYTDYLENGKYELIQGYSITYANWITWEHRFFWFGVIALIVVLFIFVFIEQSEPDAEKTDSKTIVIKGKDNNQLCEIHL